jgi:hypothetical protein
MAMTGACKVTPGPAGIGTEPRRYMKLNDPN